MTLEPAPQLFVVEHYDDTGGPSATPAVPVLRPDTRIAFAVHVPADDLVQVLVEGTDEGAVCGALTAAGWRVDRITRATWAGPDPSGGSAPVASEKETS